MTLWLRAEMNPSFPLFVTDALARVRQPKAGPTSSTSTSTSIFAIRANCSRITSPLSFLWALISMCWKSQPPQPKRCAYEHGGLTRSADGFSTLTTSPLLKVDPTLEISIVHSSPGIAWRTKITAPS